MGFNSINEMFHWRVQQSATATALLKRGGGRWVEISWKRYYDSVRFISQGMGALGVEKGNRVAIFSTTRVEWIFCDLAILGAGGVTVPVYPTTPSRDVEYVLTNSGAEFLVVENLALLDKVLEIRENLPALKKIILIEGPSQDDDSDIVSLSDVVELGRKQPAGWYEEHSLDVTLDDPATIVYTSGSSGPQRGVVHAHRQLLAEQDLITEVVPLHEAEITLLFLPLAHIFGRVIEFLNISTGIQLALAESYERMLENLQDIRPHIIAAVPRIYEKIYSNVLREVDRKMKVQQHLMKWCLKVGRETSMLLERKQPLPFVQNAKYTIAKRIFFDRFRENFGQRVKYLVSSGAPLGQEIGEFFNSVGFRILEAYGMTELAGAVTMNRPDDYRIGSVGKPLKDVQVRFAEDGEILVQGPTVMNEYRNNKKATEEVLVDGWLHTGDIGETDEDGFLKITDRKKDILITSGGKNIAPANIENHIKSDPYIDQVYVHGDRRNFLSALITLNEDNITQWANENGVPFRKYEDLIQKPEIKRLIESRIQLRNKDLSSPETIKKFHILQHLFSQEGGELTGTLKLKREFIDKKYSDILDRFYE